MIDQKCEVFYRIVGGRAFLNFWVDGRFKGSSIVYEEQLPAVMDGMPGAVFKLIPPPERPYPI